MAGRIIAALHKGQKVLWLICGGTNIPLAVSAMSLIASECSDPELSALTVGQTDERYGPVGHEDSNWKQMMDSGFQGEKVRQISFLIGKPLPETVATYAKKFDTASSAVANGKGLVLAQFGIGQDGHVAGIMPHSPAVSDIALVSGYEGKPYTRLTITPVAMKRIDVAYTFAFGENKRAAAQRLQLEDLPIAEEPCQLLKLIPDSYFYCDVI
jgi:6-phosphogluconolactonase/glucosamine-6-phosphate isomerase/deaminase